jgi:hypothetical protein
MGEFKTRKDFSAALIKAITDAKSSAETPKSQESLALDAFEKLHYDFPVSFHPNIHS